MQTFADALLEIELRKKKMELEREQVRWAQLAQAASLRTRKRLHIWQLVLGLGDMVSGLQCQIRNHFAVEPRSVAC